MFYILSINRGMWYKKLTFIFLFLHFWVLLTSVLFLGNVTLLTSFSLMLFWIWFQTCDLNKTLADLGKLLYPSSNSKKFTSCPPSLKIIFCHSLSKLKVIYDITPNVSRIINVVLNHLVTTTKSFEQGIMFHKIVSSSSRKSNFQSVKNVYTYEQKFLPYIKD
jgi:hypothetical protein